jgi:hypothetical protein
MTQMRPMVLSPTKVQRSVVGLAASLFSPAMPLRETPPSSLKARRLLVLMVAE